MAPFQIYIDEDALDSDLVSALRSRDVSVTTVLDAGLVGATDDQQLQFAAAHDFVLYSFNLSDFYRLHTEWVQAGRTHGGVILARQQRFSVGEQLHRLLRLRASIQRQQMKNRVEFLNNWV